MELMNLVSDKRVEQAKKSDEEVYIHGLYSASRKLTYTYTYTQRANN